MGGRTAPIHRKLGAWRSTNDSVRLRPAPVGVAANPARRNRSRLRQRRVLSVCRGNVDEPDPEDTIGVLGVDMGVTNIAVDSDGSVHSAKAVNNVRLRHRRLRQKLQSKGTKSSRRRLKKLSGKERRFATWVNHNVSKSIATPAQDTKPDVAIELFGGIRDRVTVRRGQRVTLHSWSFFQLRTFIEYKAKRMPLQ